jgi:hypothetical protein
MPSHFTSDDDDQLTAPDGSGRAAAAPTSPSEAVGDHAMPPWFADFLIDRSTRKPSRTRLRPTDRTSPRWQIC